MTYFWIVLTLVTLYAVVVTVYCLKFAITVLKVQDAIESGIATLDEKHQTITEILSRPLFYDSPEVRLVLKDIEEARDSLHEVAYEMSANLVTDQEVKS